MPIFSPKNRKAISAANSTVMALQLAPIAAGACRSGRATASAAAETARGHATGTAAAPAPPRPPSPAAPAPRTPGAAATGCRRSPPCHHAAPARVLHARARRARPGTRPSAPSHADDRHPRAATGRRWRCPRGWVRCDTTRCHADPAGCRHRHIRRRRRCAD
ncbi:hypothetical protein G6F22_019238 [Rhizopus arrhizus]|nr:hypothetical protein G6F22_019238 [Rhizopus arrhizus]